MKRFRVASNHLTEEYFAPVPSQFSHMPRATQRHGDEYSVLGYCRALAQDCIAITGGGLDAPLEG